MSVSDELVRGWANDSDTFVGNDFALIKRRDMARELLALRGKTIECLATDGVSEGCKAANLLDQITTLSAELRESRRDKRELLALREAMKEPVAWLIEYRGMSGVTRRIGYTHNAVADYREFDPNATSTPLYALPAPPEET